MLPAQIIRLAMLLGVLLLGGAVYYMRQSGDAPSVTAEQADTLRLGAKVAWALAIVVCGFLYIRRHTSEKAATATLPTSSIAAWAFGEGVALLGALIWMQTGSPDWYFPGLLFLVVTFVAFPARA